LYHIKSKLHRNVRLTMVFQRGYRDYYYYQYYVILFSFIAVFVVTVVPIINTMTTATTTTSFCATSAFILSPRQSSLLKSKKIMIPPSRNYRRQLSRVNAIDKDDKYEGDNTIVDKKLKNDNKRNQLLVMISNFDQIRSNVLDGEVGQRGEIYVILQVVLFVSIASGYIPFFGIQNILDIICGPFFLILGVLISLSSVLDLGKSLSPWPVVPMVNTINKGDNNNEEENDDDNDVALLVTSGFLSYGQVRHPLYLGVLLIGIGLSIVTNSVTRLLLTILLYYLFELKTEYEEKSLKDAYPISYESYMEDVPTKFIPKLLLQIIEKESN